MKKQGWGKRFTVRPYGGTYKRFVHHTVAFGFIIEIKSGIPFKRIGRTDFSLECGYARMDGVPTPTEFTEQERQQLKSEKKQLK